MKSWRIDPWLLFLILAGAVLLLTGLGNGRLWQDEAETAVLAKNVLRFGYPRAFDGVNRLNPGLPVGPGDCWTYHTWGSFYWAALSFLLLGAGTMSARLPFALLGLAAVPLAYRAARRMTASVSLARWTAALLLLSVPFLLHMRQCRYYAPSTLFSLWAVSAYWRLLSKGRRAVAELAAALIVLFHFNQGLFLPTAAAIGIHGLFLRDRAIRSSLLQAACWVAPLTLPFLWLLQAWQHHSAFSWREIRHHAEFYFRQINHYVFPVTFWLLLLPFWRPNRARLFGPPGGPVRAAARFTFLYMAIQLLFFIFGPAQRHFRYLIHLLPFFFLLQAIFLRDLIRHRRKLGLCALLLMTFTDLHYTLRPRCLQAEFLGELCRRYKGPVDGIVELLNREGKPGETVKTPYDDHAILFYTPLRIEPIPKPEDFLRPTTPEWIIPRRDWTPEKFYRSGYLSLIRSRYRQITLDAPDIPWQNRPDPGYHRFRTDRQAPPVVVYRRLD